MSKARKPVDEQELRLRVEARLHDGVIPVPFLGQTWRTRGAAYWRRRVGAVVLMLLALALVGAMTVAFTVGIIGNGYDAVRIALAVLYNLTAVAGVRTGLRKIAAAPLDDRHGGPGTYLPSGLLAFVLAPFGTGLVLTILLAMFGRDFIGERRAREISNPTP